MKQEPELPRAARAFVSFVAMLRVNGFAIAPEQTAAFLEAITLLGPRGPEDIRQAGLATLAPPPERRAVYDLLFQIHFLGGEEVRGPEGEDDDVVRLQDEGHGGEEPPLSDEANESGAMAVRAEALVQRRFRPGIGCSFKMPCHFAPRWKPGAGDSTFSLLPPTPAILPVFLRAKRRQTQT